MLKSVYSSPNFELQFDTVNRIQYLRYKGDVSDDEYKFSWEKGFQHVTTENINRVLVDQHDLGKISALARGWAVVNAFPKIQKNYPSDLAAAVITSKKVHERPAIQYLVNTFKRMTGFQIEFFQNEEEAVNWLLTANILPAQIKPAS